MPNFKLSQDWVGYLQRSYYSIKQSIMAKLTTLAPELTDHTESNLLVLIVSIFSGIAENLNLYIDRIAQESFIGTARRYSSVIHHAKLVDYRVKSSVPATANMRFTLTDSAGLTIVAAIPIVIPLGTQVNTSNNIPYFTTEVGTITPGNSSVYIPVQQSEQVLGTILDNTTGVASQKVELPDGYQHKTAKLDINGDIWTEISSLGLASSTSKVFIVEVSVEGKPYILFGDGISGAIPTGASTIIADYYLTYGKLGNVMPSAINKLISTVTLPPSTALVVNNDYYASGGNNVEDIEMVRALAPMNIRTLDRAVTGKDYEDIALLMPGVSSAKVKYCCGECVRIYIAPIGIGTATTLLLSQVKSGFDCKRMLGRCVTVLPAGITRVWLKLTIQAKYGIPITTAELDFRTAAIEKYGYDASKIDRPIMISDITAFIDNIPTVEYINLEEIWAEPFARPSAGVSNLLWTPVILINSVVNIEWFIIYRSGTSNFEVYKAGILLPTPAQVGVPFSDPDGVISFTINALAYTEGDRWDFTTLPYGKNLIIADTTVPILDVDPLVGGPLFMNLTILSSNQSSNCNTNC